ncbi:40S ribosomal protein S3-A [Tupaia chinensis]|uniref:40S ribosomal protein S3-A n=1 Tax=Tupaia chinensis TaxID=246437 RepID=L9L6L4_TUPCH|nr:40S ribosomal protein S3-A [Tupaia chinensis]
MMLHEKIPSFTRKEKVPECRFGDLATGGTCELVRRQKLKSPYSTFLFLLLKAKSRLLEIKIPFSSVQQQDGGENAKNRKFVTYGIFKAELNEFLTQELAKDGYSGVEGRVTPTRTEIIILATRTQNVLGEKGQQTRELTAVIQKRFGFPEGSVELYAEKVATRSLFAIVQAESL